MLVDYDEVLALAKEHRPKLIVCGGSAYPRAVEADRFREIADEVGALLLCDMAHFAGPRRRRPAPEPGAALRLRHLDDAQDARRAARRLHPLPRGARAGRRPRGLPRACRAARSSTRSPRRRRASRSRRPTPSASTSSRCARTPTRSPTTLHRGRARRAHRRHRHASAADRPAQLGVDGQGRGGAAATRCKITVNRNTVPFDERPPTVASGVRIGTPAATMRGFDEDDFREVGADHRRRARRATPTSRAARRASTRSATKRPLYPGFRGYTTYAA